MKLSEAIEVLKEAKYIGSDKYATDYDKRMNEAIDTVVAEVETKNYTAEDMEAFAEFLIGRNTAWITELERNETAKTLIELWEKERRAK